METTNLLKTSTTFAKEQHEASLGAALERSLNQLFSNLGEQLPGNLYKIVTDEVKETLLRVIMNHRSIRGNQSKAAALLGISRTTLRKMLKEFDML